MQDSKKRPLAAQGDDPARKVVKFYHLSSGKEHTGTLEEKAQMMTKWWGEIQAAREGTAALTPAPGDTTGAAPSSSAPPVPFCCTFWRRGSIRPSLWISTDYALWLLSATANGSSHGWGTTWWNSPSKFATFTPDLRKKLDFEMECGSVSL